MNGSNVLHTFTRLVAYRCAWALGPRAAALTGLLAGLVPDMGADAIRQICRWLFPIDSNIPIDALPFMLRLYGIPAYDGESYHGTLARLRDAMMTHSRAGGVDMLAQELSRITGLDPAAFNVVPDPPAKFSIAVTEGGLAAKRKYGAAGATYGRGKSYGFQAPDIRWTRNVQRMMRYFKPARERFTGLEPDA